MLVLTLNVDERLNGPLLIFGSSILMLKKFRGSKNFTLRLFGICHLKNDK